MQGRVLITRPDSDAKGIAEDVRQKGYEVFCEPFLKVIYHEVEIPDLSSYGGLIFTSVNGVRSFSQNTQDRTLPVFTVGDQTLKEVQLAGFQQAETASGNLDDLITLLSKTEADKPYLYCRGEHISGALKEAITGVRIEEMIIYHTEKQQKITSKAIDLMKAGAFSHVLFFSKRTGESFVNFVMNHQDKDALLEGLKSSKALCLGAPMLEYVSTLPWQEVRIAPHPDRNGMLDLLDNFKIAGDFNDE